MNGDQDIKPQGLRGLFPPSPSADSPVAPLFPSPTAVVRHGWQSGVAQPAAAIEDLAAAPLDLASVGPGRQAGWGARGAA